MKLDLAPAEIGKLTSARRALDFVKPDMKLGLGTGSTAAWLVKLLAYEVRENGLKFDACATSSACLLYTSPSPRDEVLSRMPSSA